MSFPNKNNASTGPDPGTGVLNDSDIQEITRDNNPTDSIFDGLTTSGSPLDTTSYPIPSNITGENALLFGDIDSPRIGFSSIPPLIPSDQQNHIPGSNINATNNSPEKLNGLNLSKHLTNNSVNNSVSSNGNPNVYGNSSGLSTEGFTINSLVDLYLAGGGKPSSLHQGGGSSGNSGNSGNASKVMVHSGSKYYPNVGFPPMPQLSESVLPPTGLNVQPLAILSKAANDARSLAAKRKKEATGPKQRPAFVMKIWSMVNDPENQEYIRWNDDGKTFEVFHREDFMKNILPKYFKHNNFASFVRQLNMYGWHKVQEVTSGSLNLSKDDKSIDEIWKFENPYFIRGREDLLDKIIRNKSLNSESENDQVNFLLVLNELDQIKMNQLTISEDLRRIRKDNKMLWKENFLTRERSQHQAQTLDKILKFLAAVYGNNANKILEIPFDSSAAELGANNLQMNPPQSPNPYTLVHVSPFQKPQLMISNQAYTNNSSDGMGNISSKTPNLVNMNQSGSTNAIDTGSSIEDIMRSYEGTPRNTYGYLQQQQQQQQQYPLHHQEQQDQNDPIPYPVNSISQNSNAHKIFEKIMRENPNAASGSISSPRHYFPELNMNSPGMGSEFRVATPIADHAHDFSLLHETNSGNDLIDHVEQNIEKQDKSISLVHEWILKLAEEQKRHHEEQPEEERDLDDFDVNEFLDNHSATPAETSLPGEISLTGKRRNEEDSNGTKRVKR